MPPDLFEDRARILAYFNSHGILVSREALEIILKRSMGGIIDYCHGCVHVFKTLFY